MAEGVQAQPLGGDAARHLHEAASTPASHHHGCVRHAVGAEPASGQYFRGRQIVCLIVCWDVYRTGAWWSEGLSRPPGLGWGE